MILEQIILRNKNNKNNVSVRNGIKNLRSHVRNSQSKRLWNEFCALILFCKINTTNEMITYIEKLKTKQNFLLWI